MYHIPGFGEKGLKHPLLHYKLLLIFLPFPFTFKIMNSRTLGLFCFPFALTPALGGPFGSRGAVFLMPPCWLESLSFPSGLEALEG